MLKFGWAALLCLFLISCKKQETLCSYFIANNSSQTLLYSGSQVLSDSIPSGQSRLIKSVAFKVKESSPFEPAYNLGNDLNISNVKGKTVKKDYTVQTNWITEVSDKKNSSTHKYTFSLSDSDF